MPNNGPQVTFTLIEVIVLIGVGTMGAPGAGAPPPVF